MVWQLNYKLIEFYNENYALDDFNKVKFTEVQKLAKTCSTGCEIADPVIVDKVPSTRDLLLYLSNRPAK